MQDTKVRNNYVFKNCLYVILLIQSICIIQYSNGMLIYPPPLRRDRTLKKKSLLIPAFVH